MGVSRDGLKSHQRFSDKLKLSYSLLVDQDQLLHDYFGVLKEKKLFGKVGIGTERSTFVINGEGRLVGEFRNVKSSGHALEMLDFLRQQEDTN